MLLAIPGVVAGIALAAMVVGMVALRRIYHVPRNKQTASPQRMNIPFSTVMIPAQCCCTVGDKPPQVFIP